MKLTQASVTNLSKLLKVASIVKIDRLIIEDGTIRGIDDNQTVVIISKNDVPDFGGSRAGLMNLNVLANRLNLFAADKMEIEAVEVPNRNDSEVNDVAAFKIAANKSKFEFKLGRADLVKAPKKMNDDFVWCVKMKDVGDIKTIMSASNTIDSEQIAIVSKQNGEVSLELVDSATQDTFTIQIAEEAEWLGDEDRPTQSFVHYYNVKALLPLLKAAAATGEVFLVVGEQGMLQVTVENHTFTLLPREEE